MEPDNTNQRRRGRLAAALLVAGVLAAVPAGVALADGSSDSSGPDRGQPDRHDCPEDRGRGSQEI